MSALNEVRYQVRAKKLSQEIVNLRDRLTYSGKNSPKISSKELRHKLRNIHHMVEAENAKAVRTAVPNLSGWNVAPMVQSELAPALISIRNLEMEIEPLRVAFEEVDTKIAELMESIEKSKSTIKNLEPGQVNQEMKDAVDELIGVKEAFWKDREKLITQMSPLAARRDNLVKTIVSRLADSLLKRKSAESPFSLLDPTHPLIDSLAKKIETLGQLDAPRARELAEMALWHAWPAVNSKHVTFLEDEDLAVVKAFEFEGKQFKLDKKKKIGEGAGAQVRFYKHGNEILVLKAMKPHEGTTQYGRNAELVNETWMQSVASGDPADPKVVRPRGILRLSNSGPGHDHGLRSQRIGGGSL